MASKKLFLIFLFLLPLYPQMPSYWQGFYSPAKRREYERARVQEALNDIRLYCNKKPEEVDAQELYRRAGRYRTTMQLYGMNPIKGICELCYPGGLKGLKCASIFSVVLGIVYVIKRNYPDD